MGLQKGLFSSSYYRRINLVNTGIREYLVSMVIFLIPRFMRVYSFLESCFGEDNLLCLF
jgi:hypothetical protein